MSKAKFRFEFRIVVGSTASARVHSVVVTRSLRPGIGRVLNRLHGPPEKGNRLCAARFRKACDLTFGLVLQ